MTKVCGPEWLERGELSVKFTKPVFAQDVVTVTAAEAGAVYELQAQNQQGDLLMVGEARLR
jgi:hypothetical protein